LRLHSLIIITAVLLSSIVIIVLAIFSGINIHTLLSFVNGPAEANAVALSSSSDVISNKSVDIPAIPASKIKFSKYDNPTIGIRFFYPSGWEPMLKETSNNSTVIEILFPNRTIGNNSGNFSSGHWHGPSTSFIVLSIEDVSSSYSINSNTKAALDLLTKQNLDLAKRTLPNFHLIDSNTTSFAEKPAHRIVYSFTEPSIVTPSDFPFQSMNIWTINAEKKYTISYSQPIEEYPTYLGVVQQMIESFEITR